MAQLTRGSVQPTREQLRAAGGRGGAEAIATRGRDKMPRGGAHAFVPSAPLR